MSEGSLEQVLSGDARWCVVQGRCQDVLAAIPPKSIGVTCSDPPYSAEVHSRSIRRTYLPDVADQPCRRTRKFEFEFPHLTPEEQDSMASEFARVTRRWVLVFSDTETAASWRTTLTAHGLDFVRFGFWVKDRAMPQITGDRPGSRVEQITIAHPKGRKRWNGGGLGNVWQHPVVANCNGHRSDRIYSAQKPETLLLELLELFTEPDEIVLDPTCGSSTTGVACLRLGRRYIGIDQLDMAVELSRERLRAEQDGSTLSARRSGQIPMFATEKETA